MQEKNNMQLCSIVILSCMLVLQANGLQHVPPGVNPGYYQQNSPPPPQQQQQFQGGQKQQQFQQPPPQQFQPHSQQQQFQGQRVPPGVNPGHYQQNPPPPSQQQQQFQGGQQQQFQDQPPSQQQKFQEQVPQQQFQQPPLAQQQQFQQLPTQQQQFEGQSHQQPQPQPHQHQDQFLHQDVTKEKEHIAEHMDVPIDTSKMSEEELQFHYFKMHDADGDSRIDGCELVKSLTHRHDHSNHNKEGDQPLPEEKIYKDDELMKKIDPILATVDKNHDGFIDYPEYIFALQAATAQSKNA